MIQYLSKTLEIEYLTTVAAFDKKDQPETLSFVLVDEIKYSLVCVHVDIVVFLKCYKGVTES